MFAPRGPLENALTRLRTAADEAQRGWYPRSWGNGELRLLMQPSDIPLLAGGVALADLPLEASKECVLTTRLHLPERVAGVPVDGQRLVATVCGYYPMDVAANGRSVLHDDLPVVACGPASVELLEAAHPGDNGDLIVRVLPPTYQISNRELYFSFTTPALWARFLTLDTAWAELRLAAELAATDAEHKAVEMAATTVPPGLLELSETGLASVAEALERELDPLTEKVRGVRVHAIGHSHIDLEWQWTWDDTREVIKRDVRSALALMDEFADMTFTHSQPASYEVLRQEAPDLFARVCDRIAEGRWEPATMQWVEGDVNLASGEAQVRQLLEGVTYTRDHLGVRPKVHLAPDTFGHTGNLPQLSVGAGAKIYYHHRGNPGQASGGSIWPAYWWRGVDGTRLLAVSSPLYLGPLTPGRVVRDAIAAIGASELSCLTYFYGVGDHGGGPTRRDLETLHHMQASACLPSIWCSTLEAFADEVLASGRPLPEHQGESPTIFEGCYVSHADAKHYNRAAENELVMAESLATLAGDDRHRQIASAWRSTLFHQFHDILCGSAIREAYDLTYEDYARTRAVAQEVSDQALDALEEHLPAGAIAVTNPLGITYQGIAHVTDLAGTEDLVLIDEDGKPVPAQRSADGLRFPVRIPAFATPGYRVGAQAPAVSQISVTDDGSRFVTVDTPHFFAMIRRDCGVITTLFDKRLEQELVGYNIARAVNCEQVRPDLGLGVLQIVDERPHGMSSWVIDEVYREQSLIDGGDLVLKEVGPVRVVLETAQRVRSSTITKRVIFYAHLARIDIELEVDWQEPGSEQAGIPNLALAFTTRQRRAQAWYETPFAAAERPADGLVVPALRWVDVSGDSFGLAVLNDSKYGFDALGPRLRAHLVRTSYSPDPLSDQGRVDHSSFAIVPHAGRWSDASIPQLAMCFNTPLAGRVAKQKSVQPPSRWRPRLAADGTVIISAFKFSHAGDGSRVIRMYESAGQQVVTRLEGLPDDCLVYEASPTEEIHHRLPTHGGALELGFRPFQVRTLVIAPTHPASSAAEPAP